MSRVLNAFIGNGAAFPANDTALSLTALNSKQLGIFGSDMKALNPDGSDTPDTQDTIYIVQRKSATDLKRSFPIHFKSVTKYVGEGYAAAKTAVVAVGYSRQALTGAIVLNNESVYELIITYKHDKSMGSERSIVRRYNYTSDATATQLEVASYFVNAINNDYTRGSGDAKAKLAYAGAYAAASGSTPIKYGDNTGGTDYGIEIYGETRASYSTEYGTEQVNFEVFVDTETGFGATPIDVIQTPTVGNGTYNQVSKLEKWANGYEGQTNLRQFPVVSPTLMASSDLILSDNVTGTATIASASLDKITFTDAPGALIFAGDFIAFDTAGTIQVLEVLYYVSTTVAIVRNAATAAATKQVGVYMGYSTVTLECTNSVVSGIASGVNPLQQRIVIHTPAIAAGAAANTESLEGADVVDVLNGWLGVAGSGFADVALTR